MKLLTGAVLILVLVTFAESWLFGLLIFGSMLLVLTGVMVWWGVADGRTARRKLEAQRQAARAVELNRLTRFLTWSDVAYLRMLGWDGQTKEEK
jgi:uncharacterized membrane protein